MIKKILKTVLVTIGLLILMAVIGIGMLISPLVLIFVVIGGLAFMAYALVDTFWSDKKSKL